jgi:hypothetical protein
MFKNIVPTTIEQHKNIKVSPVASFDFAKGINLASIMVHEFSRAASIYPIVFLEDKEKDEFKPVVLMGLEEGENLFVEDGKWLASYIPAIIRRYPFALANTEEEDRYTICMDESSESIGTEAGEAIFNEDGSGTEVIERVKTFLTELQQMEQFNVEFCRFLAEKNMFTPLNMQVRVKDETKNITGCYVLNEERLNSLSDQAFTDMRSKKYLAPIYAHVISLAQVERLLRFKDDTIGITEVSGEIMPENNELGITEAKTIN